MISQLAAPEVHATAALHCALGATALGSKRGRAWSIYAVDIL